jgi:glucose/mannose-6-phosphate isomerase
LPHLSHAKERLWVASSYSGNTEETIDFAKRALKRGYPVAAISIGGTLIEFAVAQGLPHIVIPDTKIQPRGALGFALVGLAAFLRDKALLLELHALASQLKPSALEKKGKTLAGALRGKAPVVYSSTRNQAIAYNWKIKFNETGKIPAFYNVFPELNHNEMTGFDIIAATRKLSRVFHFIFLTDRADHPQIQTRMAVCKKLYEVRGLPVTEVALQGRSVLERIFSSLILADWTALHLSRKYGTEAQEVPMVETFKRLITVLGNK